MTAPHGVTCWRDHTPGHTQSRHGSRNIQILGRTTPLAAGTVRSSCS